MAPYSSCGRGLRAAPWPESVLLASVFLAIDTVVSQDAQCGSPQVPCSIAEEEVVLLQTMRTNHQRNAHKGWRGEEDSRSVQNLMDHDEFLQSRPSFSEDASRSLELSKLHGEQSTLGDIPEDAVAPSPQKAVFADEAASLSHPANAAVLSQTGTASTAGLRAQLQIVSMQRDKALEQAEVSSEALRFAQEELQKVLVHASTTVTATVSAVIPTSPTTTTKTVYVVEGTTQAPNDLPTFNGRVTAPVGLMIWVLFGNAILCCCGFVAYCAYAAYLQRREHFDDDIYTVHPLQNQVSPRFTKHTSPASLHGYNSDSQSSTRSEPRSTIPANQFSPRSREPELGGHRRSKPPLHCC